MKQFFGAFFGSMVGLIVATVLGILLVFVLVKSSVSSALKDDSEPTVVKSGSVLKFEIDGAIGDREKENPFEAFGGKGNFGGAESPGLNTLSKKIEQAKTDDKIKGIFINIKQLQAGFATIQELRNMLLDFRKSGKYVYCYSENYNQLEYYLASAADKVYVHPNGNVEWKGLYMGLMFFKNALSKLEIEMQVFRHGKFKSAVEPFMLDKMSESNRYQSETFIGSIWNSMLEGISKERKLSVAELNRMANTLEIQTPADAKGKLVDELAYEDEVLNALKKKNGLKEDDKLPAVNIEDYDTKPAKSTTEDSKVAVIYAIGSINSGEGSDDEIGSDRIAKAIREARTNTKIKAIVLRVNSPGGSALASDVIWREMVLAKKAKPTVVSMGDLAASGGYYISCGADRIFAQPNTITGSIGVFGLMPNFQKMLSNKLGITIDTVNTNKYSDFGNGLRPVTDYERQVIQTGVEKIYDTFTGLVAQGRGLTKAEVDSIGQGRVWSGTDAIQIGLVDELGGLDKAIAWAAQKAKLKDYKTVELPKQKNPFDDFFGSKEKEFETAMLKRNLGSTYVYLRHVQQLLNMKGIQARLPFEIVYN